MTPQADLHDLKVRYARWLSSKTGRGISEAETYGLMSIFSTACALADTEPLALSFLEAAIKELEETQ